MHFLPDVYVPASVRKGQRYNRETLEIRWRGKNIHEVLQMNVGEALRLFQNVPGVGTRLQTLMDVGLSYLQLGQSATTLSGGEAQRVKLARELAKRATGPHALHLDEPTTGLHFHDVAQLLDVLHRLRDEGNTVVVIEHNLDVIKTADWIIDPAPKGAAAAACWCPARRRKSAPTPAVLYGEVPRAARGQRVADAPRSACTAPSRGGAHAGLCPNRQERQCARCSTAPALPAKTCAHSKTCCARAASVTTWRTPAT